MKPAGIALASAMPTPVAVVAPALITVTNAVAGQFSATDRLAGSVAATSGSKGATAVASAAPRGATSGVALGGPQPAAGGPSAMPPGLSIVVVAPTSVRSGGTLPFAA